MVKKQLGLVPIALMLAVLSATVVVPARAEAGSAGETKPAVQPIKTLESFTITGTPQTKADLTSENDPAFTDAELQDLQTLAESEGTDIETLKGIQFGVNDFGLTVDAVAKANPDIFVQAEVGTAEDPTPWIVFTTKPSDSVLEPFTTLTTNTEVFFGAPASSRELDRIASDLVDALSAIQGVESAGAGSSDKGMSIEAYYTLDTNVTRTTPAEREALEIRVLNAVAANSPGHLLPVPIILTQQEQAPAPEAIAEGGQDLSAATDFLNATVLK